MGPPAFRIFHSWLPFFDTLFKRSALTTKRRMGQCMSALQLHNARMYAVQTGEGILLLQTESEDTARRFFDMRARSVVEGSWDARCKMALSAHTVFLTYSLHVDGTVSHAECLGHTLPY